MPQRAARTRHTSAVSCSPKSLEEYDESTRDVQHGDHAVMAAQGCVEGRSATPARQLARHTWLQQVCDALCRGMCGVKESTRKWLCKRGGEATNKKQERVSSYDKGTQHGVRVGKKKPDTTTSPSYKTTLTLGLDRFLGGPTLAATGHNWR